MKNLILIFCFILFGWNDITSSETINLKVMAWNIWHGGKGESLPVEDGRPEITKILIPPDATHSVATGLRADVGVAMAEDLGPSVRAIA